MKRLHNLFERYFEEAKNLKNAEKSLPADLAIEMQKNLGEFYKREMTLLSLQVEREFKTSEYYENYKSSQTIPDDIKKPWYKRILRKVKTVPNDPAKKIMNRVDDELRALNERVSNMLAVDDVAEQHDDEQHGDGAPTNEPEAPAQSEEEINVTPQKAKKHNRRKKHDEPPATSNDEPRLVEVQTPLGAQIKLEFQNREQDT